MIIDAHAHVYLDPKINMFWRPQKFLSAADQITVMDKMGIDKAVILSTNNAENPAEYQSISEVLTICQKYPGRFIPFCNLDPRLPFNPDMITAEKYEYMLKQFKDLGCKGLGELVARLYWDDPLMLMMFQACEKLDLPVLFHTISPQTNTYGVIDDLGFPRLEKVLKKFPKLPFIGHSQCFWAEIGGRLTQDERDGYPTGPVKPGGMSLVSYAYPNLYADISAGSGYNALTRDEQFGYEFVDEFQDRILFGLDNCSANDNLPQHLDWLKTSREKGKISNDIYEKITWKNLNRILKLGLE